MLEELFGYDPEITVMTNMDGDEGPSITFFVNNQTKADALAKILPISKQFGNVTLFIYIKPANETEDTTADIFRKAFQGNPVFQDVIVLDAPEVPNFAYVEFVNTTVQYFDDRLDDPNGYRTTVYEDIAREVFDDVQGVFFCTDIDG
jgi:hypothetical protein